MTKYKVGDILKRKQKELKESLEVEIMYAASKDGYGDQYYLTKHLSKFWDGGKKYYYHLLKEEELNDLVLN